MDELIFLVQEAHEGGFTARALGVSIFTEADDFESLRAMALDAARCHFDEDRFPRRISIHTVLFEQES